MVQMISRLAELHRERVERGTPKEILEVRHTATQRAERQIWGAERRSSDPPRRLSAGHFAGQRRSPRPF